VAEQLLDGLQVPLRVVEQPLAGRVAGLVPRLLTVEEAAERCRISRPTYYRLASAGLVPGLKIGGSIRVPAEQLETLMRGDVEASGGVPSFWPSDSQGGPVSRQDSAGPPAAGEGR
jgi:excisionase family DNA binding protein